jgi:uncharacterized membrane protein
MSEQWSMENMEQVVVNYLKLLKIPVSMGYCSRMIVSHPQYPSILSVVDSLERLGVPYKAVRINRSDLIDLSFPYLLHFEDKGEFELIKNEKELNHFVKRIDSWNGLALIAEYVGKIKDKENNKQYFGEKFIKNSLIILLIMIIVLFNVLAIRSNSLGNLILAITSFAGVVIGYILVGKDTGIKYKAVEAFCADGKSTSCDTILNSSGATVFGVVKFSDLVLTYFTFQCVLSFFSVEFINQQSTILITLKTISLLTIPVMIYSMYYQWRVENVWCKLCLIVNAILSIQLVFFIFSGVSFQSKNFDFVIAVSTLMTFPIIGILILFVKTKLLELNESYQSGASATRVKHSFMVFDYLLREQKQVDVNYLRQELRIGNFDAPTKIIVISSFYCEHCRTQYEKLQLLIEYFSGDVEFMLRFSLSIKDSDRAPTTNQHLIQYWQQNILWKDKESERTNELVNDWFQIMDLEKFMAKYPISGGYDDESATLAISHYEWITKYNIFRMPAIFINGYQLPRNYDIEDLFVLIPEIIDNKL